MVAAGPGSGKTRLLVHKLASLLTLEDIKHDQLLMLTFSRAAATEFKSRLLKLIGNAAHFVQIRTFHSYCFDLLGKYGSLAEAADVIPAAIRLIRSGEVEPGQITRSVLVIDEAQDMNRENFELVQTLMDANENMRVIAVGDDDQNIYAFRQSDSGYMLSLIRDRNAKLYEMTENYRSDQAVISLANAFASGIRGRMKKNGIFSAREETGSVRVIRYRGGSLIVPLVNILTEDSSAGSRCVLTRTNEEAACITGMLNRKGFPARLIQSNDGFPLTNLAEIRFFLARLDDGPEMAVYMDEPWQQARRELRENYQHSTCLPLCERMLDTFETVNRQKYRSDFREFLTESGLEDFAGTSDSRISVSTIHKAKGMEFDHVTMLLRRLDLTDDNDLRTAYVGMTRARHSLTIHTLSSVFNRMKFSGLELKEDPQEYGEPDEIMIPLTHRDVNLGFYKGKKDLILRMRSGDILLAQGMELMWQDHGKMRTAVRYSAACRERIAALAARGFRLEKATIRFIVYWKAEEDPEETAVVLPDLYFRRAPENSGREG